jgi:hypothetical protein
MDDDTREQRDLSFRDLIAKALATIHADELRTLVGSNIAEAIKAHDVQRIIAAVVEPVVKQMTIELLKDETVLTVLRERVKQEIMQANVALTRRY